MKENISEFIQKNNGLVKYADLIKAGFYKSIIKKSLDSGEIKKLTRGVYCLTEIQDVSHPELVNATFIIPNGVICLITALYYHQVTDEIPRLIDVAIPSTSRAKNIQDFPIHYYRFSQETWEAGIEEHTTEGYKIRIYSLAKTIADCFKFRNQIGIDVAQSSLKQSLFKKKVDPKEILKYAKICRVDNIIIPYIEAMLS